MTGVVELPGLTQHGSGQVKADDLGAGEPEQGGIAAGAAAGVEDARADVWGRRGQAGEAFGLVGSGVVVDAAGVVDGHTLVSGTVGANPGVGVAWRLLG